MLGCGQIQLQQLQRQTHARLQLQQGTTLSYALSHLLSAHCPSTAADFSCITTDPGNHLAVQLFGEAATDKLLKMVSQVVCIRPERR